MVCPCASAVNENSIAVPLTVPLRLALPNVPGVGAGERLAVLLEADRRRAGALVGLDVEGPVSGDVDGLRAEARAGEAGDQDDGDREYLTTSRS